MIYCGKCHVPKQCVIKNIRTGKNMTVNCICRCEADISKEKSKKREEEQLAKIKENCKMPGIFWNADFSEIEDEKKRTNAEIISETLIQLVLPDCSSMEMWEPAKALISYGNTMLPFTDHFPTNTKMFKLMTTRLSDEI